MLAFLLVLLAFLGLGVPVAHEGHAGHGSATALDVVPVAPATISPTALKAVTVTIADFAFSPAATTVGQGTGVTWSNLDSATHNSVSNQGFWSSGPLDQSETFTTTMRSAGTFRYQCTLHSGMNGVVRVPVRASGSATDGWTLRWSAGTSTPANRTFDVQVKPPGSTTWQAFRTNTKSRTGFFNPAKNGTWQVRARTDNTDNGQSSGWSPVRSLKIS